MVFDKTGTLTKGVFQVVKVCPAEGFERAFDSGVPQPEGDGPEAAHVRQTEEAGIPMEPEGAEPGTDTPARMAAERLLELAAYAESYSNHPISKSLKEAYGRELRPSLVSDVEEISGHGVKALVDGVSVAAGNARLMAVSYTHLTLPTMATV